MSETFTTLHKTAIRAQIKACRSWLALITQAYAEENPSASMIMERFSLVIWCGRYALGSPTDVMNTLHISPAQLEHFSKLRGHPGNDVILVKMLKEAIQHRIETWEEELSKL
jgi:hypothetical protein